MNKRRRKKALSKYFRFIRTPKDSLYTPRFGAREREYLRNNTVVVPPEIAKEIVAQELRQYFQKHLVGRTIDLDQVKTTLQKYLKTLLVVAEA